MPTLKTIKLHFSGTPGRRERILGIEFSIHPVVMLVEGVHQGLGSEPAFYSAEVIAKSAAMWAGAPVPIGHPINAQGDFCMLKEDHEARGLHSVGVVDKPISKNGRLTAVIALNVNKANEKEPGLIGHLDLGGKLEVSTGLLAIEDRTPGIWNGEPYATRILEIIPDHLALLPNAQGACSWQDGCGVRYNSNFNNYGVNQMEQEAYVQPVLFAKTNLAVETATKALINQHGDMAGRAKARSMTLAQLIQLGETLLNVKDDERQAAEEEVLIPVQMFGGR
jgi:hypothetical protein